MRKSPQNYFYMVFWQCYDSDPYEVKYSVQLRKHYERISNIITLNGGIKWNTNLKKSREITSNSEKK